MEICDSIAHWLSHSASQKEPLAEMSNYVLVIAGVIQAAAALAIAWLARRNLDLSKSLARVNRRLARAELEPRVVAYCSNEVVNKVGGVFLNVENMGRGAATNVVAKIEFPGDEFPQYKFERLLERMQGDTFNMRFLAPGVRAKLQLVNRDFENVQDPPPPLKVTLFYESSRDKTYRHTYELDVQLVSPAWNISRR